MESIDWVCQGCGKAYGFSIYQDNDKCSRCGWKRKDKLPSVIQREKDLKEGNIRDKDNNIIVTGVFHRFSGAVINPPASKSNDHRDCCPRIC